ncbi:hypothetical protein, partial [Xenorhabdus sp. PB62.4]|uniref:hypothetical protein n=1 Tax=Xenorhabdus sp. PB62.4 TaxID=1851573 RepID=UPI001CA3EFB7
ASGVKRLFSLPSDFPQRLVSAQRRSVVAHYREFYGADNSFFEFFFRSCFFSTNLTFLFFFHPKSGEIGNNYKIYAVG